ncbi:glycosyltransferase [Cellulomonas chengniuliangii]|uniref:Glycosyltransferase n=1 Tax=Cellulomonas chengniuliangii TaxID=2968084 RepID=A0ABY5KYI8_9CELL|nr:glycosyltransferase [Cellulomonas chengniuliangii]UUI74516.1 glycosyltransferase [Cellulomonas chengniuliangii]
MSRETAGAGLVMIESLLRHHPTATVHVLDVDDAMPEHLDSRVVVRSLDDQDLGSDAIRRAALALGRERLVEALRATLIGALLDEGTDRVLFLEPTSFILGDLSDLDTAARSHAVVAAPRVHGALPMDDRHPDDDDLRAAGLTTGSVFAVSQAARDFLRWWASRAIDGFAELPWLDHVLTRLPHVILRDPGVGVSAWSITTPTDSRDGALHLDGAPVRHISLAGFDARRPWLLDPRLARPRVLLSEHPALAELCRSYAAAVETSERQIDPDGPLRFASLGSGLPVHAQAGSTYRHALELSRRSMAPEPPVPFDPAAPDALREWLLEPDLDGGELRLSRYLMSIYRDRPDLAAALPGVPLTNSTQLVRWAADHGQGEAAYDPDLLDASVRAARELLPLRELPSPRSQRSAGVNVVGYLSGELGVGESARLMLDALDAANVPRSTTAISRKLQSRQRATYRASSGLRFDTTLLCVNADMTADVVSTVPELLRNTYRIGMWYWEVEEFPASFAGAFDHVDEVWAATDFIRDAIQARTKKPVRTITPPLPAPNVDPAITRADLGLPEGFTFLFSFDYLSSAARKNPLGLVEAFRAAFARNSGQTLVIKSINADVRPDEAERLRIAVADEPDIVLMERYLSASERDALMAHADCYISLHRAEGLGLTMAEAMALGKPVIATGYSGNMQFMNDENSLLVPFAMATIAPDAAPYPAGARWAEPDLDAAAQLMQLVRDDPEAARARGERAALDMRERHSAAVAGQQVERRLRAIRAGRTQQRARALGRRVLRIR